ncbi:high-affinity nicotinic acid transporter [Pochonia chlamydosporia 170]|uniref:High-affinity nicotinic acid transporter n=1 Tax=Pochonia chlamydosporia 170 TaxID=1380566 RepID=A0A179F301_METCM|nr:high-affinity nicotinic acid transporter [Pochonia chlamydosporia 170]OAQ59459.1 high-affinity nicotinic acid transporter [Pochonia chlamydosporia 170]
MGKSPAAQDIDPHISDADIETKAAAVEVVESSFTPTETKRLLRKLDWTLLPFLSLLYLLSFLDRANIGNAKLAGLESDLQMTGKYDYNIVVSIFYPLYVAVEIPSNLAMKRFRPSVWIPSIMVVWGGISIVMGVVKTFPGLLAARAALGLAEGGLFPGIAYFISLWYRRHECALRVAIFFSAATAAGAFGGLLARGIMEMKGLGGLNGWAWIFIIEGIITVVIAIMAYFVLHDYPSTAKFLAPDEKAEVVRRLKQDQPVLSDQFKRQFIIDALKEWKIYVQMIIFFSLVTPLYSVSIFLPTIIKSLGYANENAQLMSAPPYIAACLCTLFAGYWSDKQGHRGVYIVFFCAIGAVGFAILAAVQSNGAKYFACFLVAVGTYPNVPLTVAWNSNNIGGSVKRGVGIAMVVGSGNLGGAVSGFMFRKDDAPRYLSAYLTLVGMMTLTSACSAFLTWYLRKENASRDAEYKAPDEYTIEEKMQESDKGDNATFFRYTV